MPLRARSHGTSGRTSASRLRTSPGRSRPRAGRLSRRRRVETAREHEQGRARELGRHHHRRRRDRHRDAPFEQPGQPLGRPRLHVRGLEAARPPVHGRRRHGGPRRRRAGQQDGLRQHPAQLHQDQDRRPLRGDHQGLPRGRRPDPQPGQRQPRLPGDGDDLLDPPAPARGGPDRPRRRLAGLPHPQRPDRPALVRPQPGLGAGPAQPPDARARQPRRPQERDHPEPRPRPDRRGRHRGPPRRRAGRRLPALLRRPLRARSTTPSSAPSPATSTPRTPAAT